jgi:hypothetical protein
MKIIRWLQIFLLSLRRVRPAGAVGTTGHSRLQPRSRLRGEPDFQHGFGDRSVEQQTARRDPPRRSGALGAQPAVSGTTPGARPRLFARRKDAGRGFDRFEFSHAHRDRDKLG